MHIERVKKKIRQAGRQQQDIANYTNNLVPTRNRQNGNYVNPLL
jgi:hypothetical protein